jgi:hypothetical protein
MAEVMHACRQLHPSGMDRASYSVGYTPTSNGGGYIAHTGDGGASLLTFSLVMSCEALALHGNKFLTGVVVPALSWQHPPL